jgi:hypothetical protein
MKENKYARRNFLQKCLKLVYLLAGSGTILSLNSNAPTTELKKTKASKKQPSPKLVPQEDLENPCDDLSKVSADEISKRKKLAYVSKSPIEDNNCQNCNLFIPAPDKPCGACLLFKGPVSPEGHCAYWAPINDL